MLYVTKKLEFTFDRDIKCSRFRNNLNIKPHIPISSNGNVIMEIKTPSYYPYWLSKIVKKYSLKRIAFSKYSEAVPKHRNK